MTEVNVVLRYNSETQEVELAVGDEVVGASGKDEFASWATNWAEVNGYTKVVAPPVVEETPVPESEPVPPVDNSEEV